MIPEASALREQGFRQAEAWSVLFGQIGQGLIFLALLSFLGAIFAFARHREKLGRLAMWAGSIGLFAAIIVLGSLFVKDQFQYEYVRARAMANSEVHFKIAGIWAGQQGSFLLWAVCSAIFGLLAIRSTGPYMRWFGIAYSSFLGAVCGILAYETPFLINKEVFAHGSYWIPPDGVGLTPALQNYWVVIHPPTIFLGFGSLTVLFAYGVAAMMIRNATDWVPRVRPWAILSTTITGLGLIMGGFWAYETLGWGGFWAWDPVENVSFVPWLGSAVLVHGLIVQSVRKRWVGANLLIAGLPFLSFVYGTFLTRSGFLGETSVHSFAQMDRHALWILVGFFLIALAFYVVLWTIRGRALAKAEAPDLDTVGITREKAYQGGMLLLGITAVAAGVGMSIPLVMTLTGKSLKVATEQNYHMILAWFFVPLMLVMGAAPFVSWRGLPFRQLFDRLFGVLCVSIGLTGFALMAIRHPEFGVGAKGDETIRFPWGEVLRWPWITFLIFLCIWVAVANLWRMAELRKGSKAGWGGFLSHVGLAVMLGGLIVSRGFERKEQIFVMDGTPARGLDYVFTFRDFTKTDLTDRSNEVIFDVEGLKTKFVATPGLYYTKGNDGQQNAMVWPHIQRRPASDLYVALHEPVIEAWPEPQRFKIGETKTASDITVKYRRFRMEGEPGMVGTKFIADLLIETKDGKFEASPYLQIAANGPPTPDLARINDDLRVAMVAMDAADRSVSLQIMFARPIFPIEVFYKPMTILVWVGAGILTFGGFLSAFYRRRKLAPAAGKSQASNADLKADETVSVAQS